MFKVKDNLLKVCWMLLANRDLPVVLVKVEDKLIKCLVKVTSLCR